MERAISAEASAPHIPSSRSTASQGAVSSRPWGSWHLHLAVIPHASLGMEVVEEVPEGEPIHFQACLEDPGGERAASGSRSRKLQATCLGCSHSCVAQKRTIIL